MAKVLDEQVQAIVLDSKLRRIAESRHIDQNEIVARLSDGVRSAVDRSSRADWQHYECDERDHTKHCDQEQATISHTKESATSAWWLNVRNVLMLGMLKA
jgi:hypothetical protein